MSEHTASPAEPDALEIFDRESDGGLVCRVCGALVSSEGEYSRIHWQWHEASNGA